jgi:aspartyl/glutamyl-tRNA(Asn/Gln) amidotransferase C subunit
MLLDDAALDHLFDLARIEREQDPARREKIRNDLSKILDYFDELQRVDTDTVQPLSGGTFLTNQTRGDDDALRDAGDRAAQRDAATRQFPSAERGFLKVPPIFE